MDETILESVTQLTVLQLLDCLVKLVKKDPTMKHAIVSHIEFGGITPSYNVSVYTSNAGAKEVVIDG